MDDTKKLHVGADLGGTKILAVVVDAAGRKLAAAKSKTLVAAGTDGIPAAVRDTIEAALAKAGAVWDDAGDIGVAVPGAVDTATGIVLHAPNLGWRNEPVKEKFEQVFGRGVYLDNDVNCGVLGERQFGAAKGFDNVVAFFPGTGIGGGVVVNGKLIRGIRGIGGELGHETIKYRGRVCGCGKRGCLEAYCSKTAFSKRFEKLIHRQRRQSLLSSLTNGDFTVLRSKVLAQAYRSGDRVVREVLDEGAEYLGVATANLMAILGPDIVVYGGGIMEELGKELLPVIREHLDQNLFGLAPEDVKLAVTPLKGCSGALGAAYLAMTKGVA